MFLVLTTHFHQQYNIQFQRLCSLTISICKWLQSCPPSLYDETTGWRKLLFPYSNSSHHRIRCQVFTQRLTRRGCTLPVIGLPVEPQNPDDPSETVSFYRQTASSIWPSYKPVKTWSALLRRAAMAYQKGWRFGGMTLRKITLLYASATWRSTLPLQYGYGHMCDSLAGIVPDLNTAEELGLLTIVISCFGRHLEMRRRGNGVNSTLLLLIHKCLIWYSLNVL